MAYHLSREAATDLARYLSTYQSNHDHSSEVACALYALVNADEPQIILADEEEPELPPTPHQLVYTLTIETKHGPSTTVFRTEQGALDSLAAWSRQWWPTEVAKWPDAPMTQEQYDELPDHLAIAEYFEAVDQYEWYSLDSTRLLD